MRLPPKLPVAPVGPVAPAPVAPAGPVAPGGPPAGPAGPRGPVAPINLPRVLIVVLVGTEVAGTVFGPRSMALSGTGVTDAELGTGAGPRSIALSGTGTTVTPGTSPTGTGFGIDMATV